MAGNNGIRKANCNVVFWHYFIQEKSQTAYLSKFNYQKSCFNCSFIIPSNLKEHMLCSFLTICCVMLCCQTQTTYKTNYLYLTIRVGIPFAIAPTRLLVNWNVHDQLFSLALCFFILLNIVIKLLITGFKILQNFEENDTRIK